MSEKNSTTSGQRRLVGRVVSAKASKTRVVLVERVLQHPKYGKRFRSSHRFAAHDEKNIYQPGDQVMIQETRPISRTKRWRIIKKLS